MLAGGVRTTFPLGPRLDEHPQIGERPCMPHTEMLMMTLEKEYLCVTKK